MGSERTVWRAAVGGLRLSLGFLTVLPVRGGRVEEGDAAWRWTSAWFPLVGLLIGLLLYAVMLVPVPPMPRAALVLAVWVAVTGGLHEDGWMDSVDAAFAPLSREGRLEVLKDPHVGAHAVTGAIVLLLLRFAALAAVPPEAVLGAPVIGRWAMVVSLALTTPARPEGLGARFGAEARPLWATVAAGSAMGGLVLLTSPRRLLVGWAVGAVLAWGVGWFLTRRFGGLSGDGHGAVGLAAELGALWVFVPFSL